MKALMSVDIKDTRSSLHVLAWALLAAGVLTIAFSGQIANGPASHHMLTHIALMNFLAPGLAVIGVTSSLTFLRRPRPRIWAAALAQLFLFLLWHAPPNMADSAAAKVIMHASLAAAALWFWFEILAWRRERAWMAVAALAVTGKIICLVAALYVFAPRTLYNVQIEAALADQHLAGLLMLAICPLIYLGAALLITIAAVHRKARLPAVTPRCRG